MATAACELATKKSRYWVALLTVGGSIAVAFMILAIIGLAFGVGPVAVFILTIHYNGTLYIGVIAIVVLLVVALYQRNIKKSFCSM